MSSPPVEQPQVSTMPSEKPTRMPPSTQFVSISSTSGAAGGGTRLRNSDEVTVHTAVRTRKPLPSACHASSRMGTFAARYKTPEKSTFGDSPSASTISVRATWQKPSRPPV